MTTSLQSATGVRISTAPGKPKTSSPFLRAVGILAVGVLSAAPGFALATELVLSCGAVGGELELCKVGAEAWSKKTGHTVKVIPSPNDSTERLALYQQILSSKASDLDVLTMDVVWPGILAQHLVDLNAHADEKVKSSHFKAFIDNNVVDGKLTGLPLYVDAGLLYYRKDLLDKHKRKVPATWAELTETARLVQEAERKAGQGDMWGYVFQGRAYEGLTCNALEWIESHGGGSLVDGKGQVTVNNPQAAKALTTAAAWVGAITPKGVLNYSEEEARGVFQSGKAVFMRSWPYVWSLANSDGSPVKGKIGVTTLPKGDGGTRSAATLGGWALAVSKHSKHAALAADLVLHMTGKDEQKRRALKLGFNPSITELYKDAEILKERPFLGELHGTFVNAVSRPARVTGAKYNRVSAETWDAVHRTLAGEGDAAKNLGLLEAKLKRIGRDGKW